MFSHLGFSESVVKSNQSKPPPICVSVAETSSKVCHLKGSLCIHHKLYFNHKWVICGVIREHLQNHLASSLTPFLLR